MKKLAGWIVVLVAVAAFGVYVMRPQPVAVEAVACRRGAAQAFVTEEAETRLDDVYVIAMPVDGRLLRIDMKEGSLVEKGRVIAQVDTFDRNKELKELEARVEEIRALIVGVDKAKPKEEDFQAAELAVQEAELRHGAAKKAFQACRINVEEEKKLYERSEQLHKGNVLRETDFIEARRRFLMLQAKCDEAALSEKAVSKLLDQAKVKLKRLRDSVKDNEFERDRYQAQIEQILKRQEALRDKIARSEIRAPVTGPVLEKYQESQQVLVAGRALLKIGDLQSIRVEADILSEEVGRVKVGDQAELFGPAVGETPVTGRVVRIYPAGFEKVSSLGIEQQRVKVIIAFDNTTLQLRPGVRLDVKLITDKERDALLVPERALFKVSAGWSVFVARDGIARRVPVEVGIRNDEWAQITSGLSDGDLVIPDPPPELEDGSNVAVTAADR